MHKLYELFVYGKEKAVVAGVVGIVLPVLAFVGVRGDMTVEEAFTVVITGLLTAVSVYLKRNR